MRVLDTHPFPPLPANSRWVEAGRNSHRATTKHPFFSSCGCSLAPARAVSLTCVLPVELADASRLPWYLQVAVIAPGPGLWTLGPHSSHRLYPADVGVELSNVTGQGERTRLCWPRAFYLPVQVKCESCVTLWRMDSQGPDPLLPALAPQLCGPSPPAWAGPVTDAIQVIKLHQIVMPSSKETLSLE